LTATTDPPIWKNGAFLSLWVAQAITQTAQNAIWYALLVLVEETTHSTTQLGITILSVIVPSVLFGVPAGVYVDRWDKRIVLIVTNATRAIVVAAYIVFSGTPALLYTVSFIFSVISQFFAPAETAMIPSLVKQNKLLQANSFFHLTFTASQLLGLVFFGPLLVKLLGLTTFFVIMSLLFLLCAILVWRLPTQKIPREHAEDLNPVAELFGQLREVWNLLLADRYMLASMGYLTLGGTLTLIVAMLAPRYVVDVLGISAADAVFVLAPASAGMLTAAFFLSRATTGFLTDRHRVVTTGLVIVSLAVGVVAGLPAVGRLLGMMGSEGEPVQTMTDVHFALVGGVMLAALVAGFGFASIVVASQTLLQERAPVQARGRVFAVQLMLGNLFSVIPLLSIGGLADLIGVTRVLTIMAVVVMVVAAISKNQRSPDSPVVDQPTSEWSGPASGPSGASH
jgi:MFS family permease